MGHRQHTNTVPHGSNSSATRRLAPETIMKSALDRPIGTESETAARTAPSRINNCDVVGKVDNLASGGYPNAVTSSSGGLNSSNLASPSRVFCRVEPPIRTPRQTERRISAPVVGPAAQRGVSEHSGAHHHGLVHGAQRPGRAITPAQPVRGRLGGHGATGRSRHVIWRQHQPAGSAAGQNVQGGRAGSDTGTRRRLQCAEREHRPGAEQ